jgi:hypothetical protein
MLLVDARRKRHRDNLAHVRGVEAARNCGDGSGGEAALPILLK